MKDINAGDDVMVTLPTGCCNRTVMIGHVFKVHHVERTLSLCLICGHVSEEVIVFKDEHTGFEIDRVVKQPPVTEEEEFEVLVVNH